MTTKRKVIIVGAGPAGLFSAHLLLQEGYQVELYDQSSGAAKKFLIAGNGGLNLTHSEDLQSFASRYGKDEFLFQELLNDFSPTDLRNWCDEIGIETFVGSSGRVFPKSLKAAEIQLNWLSVLKSHKNFHLFLKHRFKNITAEKDLVFSHEQTEIRKKGEIVIFSLGGGSWKKTGSDGDWVHMFGNLGVQISPLLPMNCGFETAWSEFFKEKVDRHCLKNVQVCFGKSSVRGEVMLTPYGIEGGAIYAVSNHLRDEILEKGQASLLLDLKPDLTTENILIKLSERKNKSSVSNHLRKSLGLDKKTIIMLRELIPATDFDNPEVLAQKIKSIVIKLVNTRPIDEAISTSGGVSFSQLNEYFELKNFSGIYFIGEMLDFEAPTGGYLLQACFSTAFRAIKGINSYSE